MKTSPVSPGDPVRKSKKVHKGSSTAKMKKKKAEASQATLSAYNIFFLVARAAKLAGDAKLSTIEALSSFDLANLVIDRNAIKDPSRSKKQKSGEKVGFKELATAIGTKWKSIDPSLKKLFEKRAEVEKVKFERELAVWKHLQLIKESGTCAYPIYQQQSNGLFSMHLADSRLVPTYPCMGGLSDPQQYQANSHVMQTMTPSTSALQDCQRVLDPTRAFLPPGKMLHPGCTAVLPLQGLQGPQTIRLPQLVPQFTLPLPSNQLPLSPMTSTHWQNYSQATMLSTLSPFYPQGFESFYNNATPSALQQASYLSPGNSGAVFSSQGTCLPLASADNLMQGAQVPFQQAQTAPLQDNASLYQWCESQRVVSLYSSSVESPHQELAESGEFEASSEDDSDIQDGPVWNDAILFPDYYEPFHFSTGDH